MMPRGRANSSSAEVSAKGTASRVPALDFPPQGRLGKYRDPRAFLDGLLDRLDVVELGHNFDPDIVPSQEPVRLPTDGEPPIEGNETLARDVGRVDPRLAARGALRQAVAGQAGDHHRLASPRNGRQLAPGVGE